MGFWAQGVSTYSSETFSPISLPAVLHIVRTEYFSAMVEASKSTFILLMYYMPNKAISSYSLLKPYRRFPLKTIPKL